MAMCGVPGHDSPAGILLQLQSLGSGQPVVRAKGGGPEVGVWRLLRQRRRVETCGKMFERQLSTITISSPTRHPGHLVVCRVTTPITKEAHTMNRYSIRKIFVWPAFKFGALIGAVLMILPGIACGLLTRSMVHALRTFVEAMGWLALGDRDMAAFAQRVVALDARGVMLIVWTALATIVIGGLLYGAGAALAALLYNLIARISGGLLVGAEAVAMPAPAAPAAPAPA
ncbi:MAG: hypothetical protein FJZ90_17375, partial [Chloroflexi bacterium]|nr:hypothetical protein [Chloroflexota bacterium]